MKKPLGSALLLALGVAGVVSLVVWNDAGRVWEVIRGGGFALLLVPAFHPVPVMGNVLSWRNLLRAQGARLSVGRLWLYRWQADAVNALLPVAQVGGEVLRGRLICNHGLPGVSAAASVIVDLTLGMTTLVVFIVTGLILGMSSEGGGTPLIPIAAGAAALGLLILLFYRLQRSQLLLRLARLLENEFGGTTWAALAGGAASLDAQLAAIYRRPGVLARSAGFWMAAWTLGTAESMISITLLGHAIGLRDALVFEAVSQAFRNAGFAIPGALGVQEGGMMVAGTLIGLPPDLALSVSLVKRMRDLVLGVPALVIGARSLAAAGAGQER